ncbi:MAG TPA: chemotaxis response regulator protein-glutamate methylesterase [Terriglobales bacterium]|nr:chemotaxis response regulator protein-glutamate methylesterase [Terriglobales bacterium]
MPRAPQRERLHVMVVDDSATVRQVMQTILQTDRRITVSVAADPLIAAVKMQKDRPDVVITDLEMPRMDGLTFLRKIMAESPIPVVVCSGFAAKGTDLALRALEEGAVEIITKPKLGVRDFLHESAVLLLDAVWSAAEARVVPRPLIATPSRLSADAVLPPRNRSHAKFRDWNPNHGLIAVGASTGGTEALRLFLSAMTPDCPPIVIVQHMPENFTRAFADRLNQDCVIEVSEARDDVPLRQGMALIAPGNFHCVVNNVANHSGASFVVNIMDGPLVSRHRPSVDVLFRSVALSAGRNAVGVIMTGMGDDGAQGLLEMKETGAVTIAQDEASCVVFGMPREAIALGAVDFVLPLDQIARWSLGSLKAESLNSDSLNSGSIHPDRKARSTSV